MKQFLVEVIVLTVVVMAVAAVAFRNQRAREILRTMRNAAWLYIGAIVLLGAIEAVRRLA